MNKKFEQFFSEFEAGGNLTDHQLQVLQAWMLIGIYKTLCEIARINKKTADVLEDARANRSRLHVSGT